MTALQKIIKGAKALQKKNKNLSWKDAIKKSSKAYNSEKKVNPKRIAAVKKTVKKSVKKAIPAKAKKAVNVSYTKTIKSNSSIKGVKKNASHKDTKSHNVNIRVVSGVNMYAIRDMQEKNIKQTLQLIEWTKKEKWSREKALTLKRLRSNLTLQKNQLRQQNKLINQNLK
jgi:hypothetical protein